MGIPKDTTGVTPEDVEAHMLKHGSDESQAGEQRDTGEDVEAHNSRWPSDESQAGEQGDGGEDVEAPRWSGV